jgi:signal peptide peptidase SppA
VNVTRIHSRVLEQISSAVWAILPDKLEVIVAMVEAHAHGHRATADEIASVLGARVAPSEPRAVDGVGVIQVFGTISPRANMMTETSGGTSAERVGQQLRAAINDPSIGSIVLDINSPGGTVSGTAELASEVFAARTRKPIVAIANDLAASAAYWIGTAATELWSTPMGDVGSVGVLTTHTDYSGSETQAGLKTTVISAGRLKTVVNPYEPLSEDGRALLQGRVDEAYAAFTQAVAKHRGVPVADVKSGFGEGALVTAKQGKALGMVDHLGSLDDAISRARQLARKHGAAIRAHNETYLIGL